MIKRLGYYILGALAVFFAASLYIERQNAKLLAAAEEDLRTYVAVSEKKIALANERILEQEEVIALAQGEIDSLYTVVEKKGSDSARLITELHRVQARGAELEGTVQKYENVVTQVIILEEVVVKQGDEIGLLKDIILKKDDVITSKSLIISEKDMIITSFSASFAINYIIK
jgi:hypothetical protein